MVTTFAHVQFELHRAYFVICYLLCGIAIAYSKYTHFTLNHEKNDTPLWQVISCNNSNSNQVVQPVRQISALLQIALCSII